MNIKKRKIIKLAFLIVTGLIGLCFFKYFNLSWVEVNNSGAQVTINFLIPMDKAALSEKVRVEYQVPYAHQFNYSLNWLTESVVEIKLQEDNELKGQKIVLFIEGVPSTLPFVSKSVHIPIQFRNQVKIIESAENRLVSTQAPFFVKFNTPMNKNRMNEFIACDTTFYMEPIKIKGNDGEEIEDLSYFKFTPKSALENGRKYILSFRKGMPSQGGALLDEDLSIVLTTDIKPIIEATYPSHKSKWIGLYPKLILETKTPTVAAYLEINNEKIKGTNKDPYHIEFLLNKVLKSNTIYEAKFQGEAASGELSEIENVQFTTVELDKNKIWIEVRVDTQPRVRVYRGTQLLKTMLCSLGTEEGTTPLGTYYIQSKDTTFINEKKREGANFNLKISENCSFQGLMRDQYWHIKNQLSNQLGYTQTEGNILLSDEDARYLYENIPQNAMVIIYKTKENEGNIF